MSIGVTHATPESAITIPQVSSDAGHRACERGDEELGERVGERSGGWTHLYLRNPDVQMKMNAKTEARLPKTEAV